MARKVHQDSRAPRALVGRTAVLTRCPGQLGIISEFPQFPPALLGESRLGPMAHGGDQLSGMIGTRA